MPFSVIVGHCSPPFASQVCGPWPGGTVTKHRARAAVSVCSQQLRTARERLQEVDETYHEHIDDRPTEAVSHAFGISHRTAARYVQQARESGLLPDTTPGKRKA